ncbi:HipA domain-containing protein, partial [Telmatospirillum sp.]|uniref:type II toxin-antitoxin system HipA family toxin n=1 Tax=Telmatospirillum sp. TaxID=2079197 RepID=UPI00284FD13D
MALHLVGETIDAASAHHKAREGELISVFRGVYLDGQGDLDTLLREYAVRIAHYIYPAAYLCSASAVDLRPTADGRLFISGRRNQRTRLRGLEIVQTKAPVRPSVDKAIIGDGMGEFTMNVSSPEQRLLEAFRMRSEHANALTEEMRRATADRLIAEYGSADAVADALWKLARSNDWFREGEGAERYLRGNARPTVAAANRAAFHLDVAWHGNTMGQLSHDGHEWRWLAAKGPNPPLIRETLPGTLPPFIESLMPEGWLAQVLNEKDQRALLRHGKRYMSNVTVGVDRAELASLPADVFHGRLRHFSKDGVFAGTYHGPDRGTFDQSFEANLARIFAAGTTPRLSGIQIKAPMFLDNDGGLMPATNLPFTHILKPAGTSSLEQIPVVEWLCLELGRLAGFTVPSTALVRMPGEMPPALLVERFDIREDDKDMRRMALEDFCSILGVPAEDKYKGTIERMARSLRGLSTNPPEDIATLFARALFAWLIADGDMHLKNVAVLKTAQPGARDFESVRMAPLYDALTTRVFPGMRDDHMALKLAGKDDRLDFKDFETLARTIELPLTR